MSCPLSEPVPRELKHTRQIQCQGFLRADGLWDIEAHLVDTKAYPLPRHEEDGFIPPGEPLHEMFIRATVDDDLRIQKIEARTLHAPLFACLDVAEGLSCLEGLAMQPGFMRIVRERLGRKLGCVHLVELLGPLATTAFQTISSPARKKNPSSQPPRFIDSCTVLRADGPAVRRFWPQWATPADEAEDGSPQGSAKEK